MSRSLRALAKTDLHVHFQGSARAATVRELARTHDSPLPPSLAAGDYSFTSFSDFLGQYAFVCGCLRTPDDLHRVAVEICEDEAAAGVRYAEVTLTVAPYLHHGGEDDAVRAVLAGFADAQASTGVTAQLVVDIVRGFPEELAVGTRDCAVRFAGEGVVALGLGGDETHPPEPYRDHFDAALAAGLKSVPHAGESTGPASIRGALDALGAHRIGHGIRVVDDPALVVELVDGVVPLEVCPTSNIATGVIATWGEHPLRDLVDAGLAVTLNSDDPAMFHVSVLDEYKRARADGFTDAELAHIARTGVCASFAPSELVTEMMADIDAWLHALPDTELPDTELEVP